MKSSLLKCTSFIPPLMESHLSTPNKIMNEHLKYLQKWRQYLYWLFNNGTNYADFDKNIQNEVDEIIKLVILIELVRQYDENILPSLDDILAEAPNFNSHKVYSFLQNTIKSPLLRKVYFVENEYTLPELLNIDISSTIEAIVKSLKTYYPGQIPISLILDFHQLCIDVPVAEIFISKKSDKRHGNGVYYTPASIVDYLTYSVMNKLDIEKGRNNSDLTIIDPSCGCGAFLIASYRYELEKLAERCHNNDKTCFAEESINILNRSIYGVDIDSNAILWAIRLLYYTLWQMCVIHNKYINSLHCTEDVNCNLICNDFMVLDDFESIDFPGRFDLIIGGPPFIRIQQLINQHSDLVEEWKSKYVVASNQFDLYMLFIEKALYLMREGGYLGMSVSNSFLRSESGDKLRELMARMTNIEEILEIKDSRVYQNALVQIALVVLNKSQIKTETSYSVISGKGNLRRELAALSKSNHKNKINLHIGSKRAWFLGDHKDMVFLHKIVNCGIPLSKQPVTIHSGIATGADNIYILKKHNIIANENESKIFATSRINKRGVEFEKDIVRPIIRGRNIRQYTPSLYNSYCICPYDKEGQILDETNLSVNYPLAYDYLKTHQKGIGKNNNVSWYGFRSESIARYFASPKIISSHVINQPCFTIDNNNLLCGSSTLIIRLCEQEVNIYFLLAVLNSSVFDRWSHLVMPTLADGWISLRIKKLLEFPLVFVTNENREIVNKIIEETLDLIDNVYNEEYAKEKNIQIDILIRKLYGL